MIPFRRLNQSVSRLRWAAAVALGRQARPWRRRGGVRHLRASERRQTRT